MKTKLLIGVVICLSISLSAQNVWTGTEDDLWSNENNWSGTVPAASDDVLIPTGFVVTLDTPANIRSIEVQGNSILNVTESLIIAVDSEFEQNVTVNWVSGDLEGPGILLNSGTINLTFPSFDLSGSVVLNNPGEINISNGGNIVINPNCVLNNSGTGIIDFQSAGSEITGSTLPTTLNNFGTIKVSLPMPSDEVAIGCQLINSDGVFQIDSGTLNMNAIDANFMGGEFNVAANATMNWNDPIDAIGVFSGAIIGQLNWLEDFIVASTAVFNFTGSGVITNIGGDLFGGGSLTNLSTINLSAGNLVINEASTLNNDGAINLLNGSDLLINANGTINNSTSGAISLLENDGNIAPLGVVDDTRVLNNEGLLQINLLDTSDEVSISIKLNNNDGQIDVNNGRLSLNYGGITLTDGAYNIDANGVLNWSFPITLTGNMTGVLDGVLNWDADLIVPTNGAFDFTGNGLINWESSDLDGGGVFTNENTIVKSTGGTKRIDNGTTMNNNGTLEMPIGGRISITTNSTLNNNASGIVVFEASTSGFNAIGATPNNVNNFGLMQSNVASGNAFISAQVVNSGVVDIMQNGLTFDGAGSLTNNASGVIKGNGTLTLTSDPADFINNGTFSPGASPGTLTVINEFNSSASSSLEIELNGTDQGVDYDLLFVDGDANLDGVLVVSLGFNPMVNDEFVVLSTSGGGDTINQCDLPNTVNASFGGFDYTFDVACRNGNELVLTVTDETLSTVDIEFNDTVIYPNPTVGSLTINNDHIIDVRLFDLNGREVYRTNRSQFSIASLTSGMYVLRALNADGQQLTKKIIKH